MGLQRRDSIKGFISDRFATEWKLLSETESYVSHTPEFPAYERQFGEWRRRLQSGKPSDTDFVTVRSEIVTLRKQLRLKGYDLSLGLQRLVVRGFRNDDCLAEGFARVVLCIASEGILFQTGTDNHVTLARVLEDAFTRAKMAGLREYHYLWYRRTRQELELSGSATETADQFKRLEERAQANPLILLSALKGLS